MGASAFVIVDNATILSILASKRPNIVALISTYVFPVGKLLRIVFLWLWAFVDSGILFH